MGRLWNKWLVPALFAVILFLCIRVANDIPKHEYYWESNEWNFMLKDMLVVLFMSYPIFFLLKYWLRLCRKRMSGCSSQNHPPDYLRSPDRSLNGSALFRLNT